MGKTLFNNKIVPPRELLRATWNKAWTKQWLLQNTSFSVPPTLVYSATWKELCTWLTSTSCPLERWIVVKPLNLSLSRGVRLIYKDSDGFRDALYRLIDTAQELFCDIYSDLPSAPDSYKWLVEEYVSPVPESLKVLEYDHPFNPLVRIIMNDSDFHFGELHIPTRASRGRGSLQGGARRICFNYKGELFQNRPNIPNDLPWAVKNYGTKIDVTGMVLPNFDKILGLIRTEVCPEIAPRALFAFDGVYKQNKDGSIDFVCIEIEHAPNVKHLARFNELRRT